MTLNRNLLERGLWTLAQAGLGFLTVELADLPVAYAPMVAAALSFLKTFVQDRLAAKAPINLDDVPGL